MNASSITTVMDDWMPIPSDPRCLIHNTINSMSNLFYEFILVVNIDNCKVEFISMASGLARRMSKYDIQDKSFQYIFETISGLNPKQVDPVFEKIISFYQKADESERPYLSFMADFPFILNEYKSIATYKFAPLSQLGNGKPLHFVVSVSYATGQLENQIMAINTSTGIRKICSLKDSCWIDYQLPQLTPIELSVLALSAQGLSVNEIAPIVSKAIDSVKSIRKRIFTKFNVDNITRAIIFAINNKII